MINTGYAVLPSNHQSRLNMHDDSKKALNMSALGLDSERKLFLPEEINFPSAASIDLLSKNY